MTVEKEWLEGKLQSLDLSDKKELIESELNYISVSTQCKLLKLNSSSLYYKPAISEHKLSLKEKINKIYEEIPLYGALKVHQQLLNELRRNYPMAFN